MCFTTSSGRSHRIQFYTRNDMAYGFELAASADLMDSYDLNTETEDINDLIEFFNVWRYIDAGIFLEGWTAEQVLQYQSISKALLKRVSKRFSSLYASSLQPTINSLRFECQNDFWFLYEHYKVYQRITSESFGEAVVLTDEIVYCLLLRKKIVHVYGALIREHLIECIVAAEWLVSAYETKPNFGQADLFFPTELTKEDRESMFRNYIRSAEPNPNYLKAIAEIQSGRNQIEISAKTKLEAKKRYAEWNNKFFDEHSGFKIGVELVFSESQSEVVEINRKGGIVHVSYGTDWIVQNLDYSTLLNNFIYLFGFVDLMMRCTLPSFEYEMGIFEKSIGIKTKNCYLKGGCFEQKDQLSLLQMHAYRNFLAQRNIRIEEVIEWFFKEYLPSEFNINGFRIAMPSEHSTSLEKCASAMPALEMVLKQYSIYCEERFIDQELLSIQSEHLFYNSIPSLVPKKYIYGSGSDCREIQFLMFSDQSPLTLCSDSHGIFYEILQTEDIKYSDMRWRQKEHVDRLAERAIVFVDNAGIIRVKDKVALAILDDLYRNEAISYWRSSADKRKKIDLLLKNGLLEADAKLFSKPEIDYFNYFLNKAEFSNGRDLKNIYSHTQPVYENDGQHQQNYIILLRLLIVTIIKINDDICLHDMVEKND